MSLRVEFVDRPEVDSAAHWTISAIGETVDLRLTWRCPKPSSDPEPAPEIPIGRLRYSLPFLPRAVDGELPATVEMHRGESKDEEFELWVGTTQIPAPIFWPMAIHALVDGPGRDSMPVAIRLLPRLSVLASGLLMAVALITFAVFGAYTLTSLELTTAETFTGVGGVALLSAAVAVARAIGRTSWPHALPYLGIPYLLPRALTTVAVAVVGLLFALQQSTVSIHNTTDYTLELKLPARDTDKLSPGGTLTYARSRAELEARLETDHGQFLCIHDVWGDASEAGCLAPAKKREVKTHRWQRYLAPPILELRCRQGSWPGVSYAMLSRLEDDVVKLVEKGEGESAQAMVRLQPQPDCKLPSPLLATLKIEALGPGDNGLGGEYKAHYPWSPTPADKSPTKLAVLGVDGAPKGTWLEVQGVSAHSESASADDVLAAELTERASSGGLVATLIRVDQVGPVNQAGVLVPAARDTSSLQVKIRSETRKTLACTNNDPRMDTHFRAVHLAVEGRLAALLEVRAESNPDGWSSVWTGPPSHQVQAWLCPVVAGNDSPREGEATRPFKTEKLTLSINPDELEDSGLILTIPRAWMASQIEIRGKSSSPHNERLGTLDCKQGAGEAPPEQIYIGSLRNVGYTPPGGVHEVRFEGTLDSTWTDDADTESKWTWVCWTDAEKKSNKLANATVRGPSEGRGSEHTGKPDLGAQELDVSRPPPVRCWRDSTRFEERPAPAGRICEDASSSALLSTNKTRGTSCYSLEICK